MGWLSDWGENYIGRLEDEEERAASRRAEEEGKRMTDTNTRWRKKPVTIDAVQFLAIRDGLPAFNLPLARDVPYWLTTSLNEGTIEQTAGGKLAIDTAEGVMFASEGDWIIRGIKGEIYPCKPDIFEATYDAADEPGSSDDVLDEVTAGNGLYEPSLAEQDRSHRHTALHLASGPSLMHGDTKSVIDRAEAFRAFLAGAPTVVPPPPSGYPAHVDRMIDEYRELNARWQALGQFFDSDQFENMTKLSADDANLMREQHEAMNLYAQILFNRLNRAGVDKGALV